jgi:hypothetical protein
MAEVEDARQQWRGAGIHSWITANAMKACDRQQSSLLYEPVSGWVESRSGNGHNRVASPPAMGLRL